MLETKVIDCEDNEINKVIKEYEIFGWQVLNTQKIDYETYEIHQRLTGYGYKTKVVSKENIYYSITFQRDKSLEYYTELCSLENRYQKNKNTFLEGMYKYRKRGINPGFLVPSIILSFFTELSFIFMFDNKRVDEYRVGVVIHWEMFLIFVLLLSGTIFLLVFGIKKAKKKNKENLEKRKAYVEYYNEYHECIKLAKELTNNANTNKGKEN